MKIAAIYTSTTPELTTMVNEFLGKQFEGENVEIASYQDPSILSEARQNGGVTNGCARRLLDMYETAVKEGATILLNICSSVGDVAKYAKPLYEMTGVGFVRIDERMAMEAVKAGRRIGVIATLPTTLDPTKRLVMDCAAALGKSVEIVDGLADGAFGLNQDQFKRMLIETGEAIRDRVDVLLFAQGSMAYAEEAVSEALGLPVFSSIRFGAEEVRRVADEMMADRRKDNADSN